MLLELSVDKALWKFGGTVWSLKLVCFQGELSLLQLRTISTAMCQLSCRPLFYALCCQSKADKLPLGIEPVACNNTSKRGDQTFVSCLTQLIIEVIQVLQLDLLHVHGFQDKN